MPCGSGCEARISIDTATDRAPALAVPATTCTPAAAGRGRAIARTGSLSEAARQSKVTYRTAWARAHALNVAWGRPLIAQAKGILSAEQFAQFVKSQENQQQMMQMGLEMFRKMSGDGTAPGDTN